jgi:hypothetical protein
MLSVKVGNVGLTMPGITRPRQGRAVSRILVFAVLVTAAVVTGQRRDHRRLTSLIAWALTWPWSRCQVMWAAST